MSDARTPPPAVAAGVFGTRLALAVQFADFLATDGAERGLIGPREVPRLWERHLLNCAVVAAAVPTGSDVADIGSGAGLPGLVLALVDPTLRLTLVEPLLRRTSFLTEAVDALGLENVEVFRGRAEELHGERFFDVVTSRAVAPLPKLLSWSLPLARNGGEVIAMKGGSALAEIEAAAAVVRKLRGSAPRIELVGEGVVDPPTTLVRVAKVG